jgi:branched-chain amino acid transport system ATP-binding protein
LGLLKKFKEDKRILNLLETPMIEIKNLYKNFGGLRAIVNIDIQINKGEIIGLIGPNGAGKTTLFNLITGFLKPDSGKIEFKGNSLISLKPHEICKIGVARTFQLVKPFTHLSVLGNIRIGAYNCVGSYNEAEKKALKLLDFIGLKDKKDLAITSLTLCDRKRVEFMRALSTSPEILLLDEVIAGLTPSEVNEIVALINKVRATGITILMIEHVMQAIMSLAERIIVIHHGKKIADGEPNKVVNDDVVIQAYLGRDFRHVATK